MTIAAQTSSDNRVSYTGNGATTSFSFPKPFTAQADLVVQLVLVASPYTATTQTLTTHYTISGTADAQGRYGSGANVVFVSAPSSLYNVVIYADPVVSQGLDLVENDPLPAEQLELSYDKLTLLNRRTRDLLARTFKLPDSSVSTGATTLEPVASSVIGFDASKNLTTYTAGSSVTVASNVTYTPPGTGAVARNMQSKAADWTSLFDFFTAAQIADVQARTFSLDLTTAVQAALAAMSAGGIIVAPPGGYLISDALLPVNGTLIQCGGRGDTTQGTVFKFTGAAKTFIKFGTSDSALNYGGGIRDGYIWLTAIDSTAVKLNATVAALVRNMGLIGPYSNFGTRTNVGIHILGGSGGASNFFNVIEDVEALHVHKGLYLPSGGGGTTQQIIRNFVCAGDAAAGDTTSIGIDFEGGGVDTYIVGGDMEDCAIGVKLGTGTTNIKSVGMRYEANTVDLSIVSGVTGCSFIASRTLDAAKISDNSGSTSNVYEAAIAGTVAGSAGYVMAANMLIGQSTKSTFTATGTGFTSSPTATFSYTVTDNQVTIDMGVITGTSNATSFTVTGFPTVIRPRNVSKPVLVRVADNSGASHIALGSLDTTGVMTLSNTLDSGGLFTNSGTKQLQSSSISYTIT